MYRLAYNCVSYSVRAGLFIVLNVDSNSIVCATSSIIHVDSNSIVFSTSSIIHVEVPCNMEVQYSRKVIQFTFDCCFLNNINKLTHINGLGNFI